MQTSASLCLSAIMLFVLGCGSSDSSDSGKGGSGVPTGGSGGTTGGSGGSAGSGGSGAFSGSTFCVLGTKGCPCDSGVCAGGLTCTNGTCCDGSDCSPPPHNTGTCPSGGTGGGAGSGGAGGGGTCTPGQVGPIIADCGYPYASDNPLTSVTFVESEVLRAIEPSGGTPLASIRLFYNDEHALTLGVRRVEITDANGTTGQDYAVTPLTTNPSAVAYPETGTNEVTGDYSGLDQSARPMWPVLYVTDTTNDANDRSGDWQWCGTPYNPNAVFGTWKSALRTVDKTLDPVDVSVTPDPDPAKNNWNLGGGDPVPPGLTNQGYGAEVRWDIVLIPGRSYRIQVLVHDGDQNKAGGDSGEACVNFCASAACPDGSTPCDGNSDCSDGYCANGCCLPWIT
jgi:hypothetical protein